MNLKDISRTTLECFDALPDSANVRLPVMLILFGCSRATFYRLIKKGVVPPPLRLGIRSSVWKVGEARASLKSLQA